MTQQVHLSAPLESGEVAVGMTSSMLVGFQTDTEAALITLVTTLASACFVRIVGNEVIQMLLNVQKDPLRCGVAPLTGFFCADNLN